ncbi:hypothetical protein PGTUg99_019735 [Puccinia graminis f. sp. tritici]|uniref:Uncharacterized protein n=1 Tax=Puccinia graminis f. sp. tritici TaxID=56615 RepID=A0A5B0NT63_PUCGR|nr:hypothetical protein PGTUg99_019735 [Puccinia graminis f. sp. tritici]
MWWGIGQAYAGPTHPIHWSAQLCRHVLSTGFVKHWLGIDDPGSTDVRKADDSNEVFGGVGACDPIPTLVAISTNGRPTSAAMPTAGRHVKPAWEVAPTAAADTSRKEAHQNSWAGAGRLAPREISRCPAVGRSSWCT